MNLYILILLATQINCDNVYLTKTTSLADSITGTKFYYQMPSFAINRLSMTMSSFLHKMSILNSIMRSNGVMTLHSYLNFFRFLKNSNSKLEFKEMEIHRRHRKTCHTKYHLHSYTTLYQNFNKQQESHVKVKLCLVAIHIHLQSVKHNFRGSLCSDDFSTT